MRAYAINEFGQAGRVQVLPDPEPGHDEVLVRVRAASVNPMDAFVVSGATRAWAENRLPLVPGLDASGVIESTGSGVEHYRAGDEIVGTAATKLFYGAGTFAELVSLPESAIARKPASIAHEAAATVPLSGLTALGAVDALNLKPDQVVLVAGATGGVGTWFTQLAASLGASVVAVARAENRDYALSLGARETADHTAGDFVEQVSTAHPEGIDAIADFTGDEELVERLLTLLKPGGRLTSSAMRIDVEAYAARSISAAQANRTDPSRLEELLGPLEKGELQSPQVRIVQLEQIGDAIAEVASRHTKGKLVLAISG